MTIARRARRRWSCVQRHDLGWIAGIIEGEGHIDRARPRVTVEMVDADVIQHLARLWGTPARALSRPSRPDSTTHYTAVCGKRAVQWMLMIYPLLGARRKARIREVMTTWKSKTTRPR